MKNIIEILAPNAAIQNAISPLIGKSCCRQKVGEMRSLSMGFGAKVPHGTSNLSSDFYGEWEIGTYTAAWRVVNGGSILCGSDDSGATDEELDMRLNKIGFGNLTAINIIMPFDIRVMFDSGIYVEFLVCTAENDEIFHVFGPQDLYIEWSVQNGWKIGKSNTPWE